LKSEDGALVLPREAVFQENGGAFVFLQDPKGWIREPVETGLIDYTPVAVHSGVRNGDVVALRRPEEAGRIGG
jgi:hypothetical protein